MINQYQNAKIVPMPQTHTRLGVVIDLLDELHSLASEDSLTALGHIGKDEIINWLRDVIYIAEETIAEIQTQERRLSQKPPTHKVIYLGEAK